MKSKIEKTRLLIFNNKKVIENYFFMTVLQILNSLFYLIIYPFLIRKLGADGYGLYVFAFSISTYFVTLVGFGFDMPAVKAIAQNANNQAVKTHTLSCVFTAKIYLEALSFVVFSIIILSIPNLRANWIIYFICFLQTLTNIFFPQWYFQGVQRMRIVTYIQIVFKLLSLPFIFLTISNGSDTWKFALIVTISSLFGAVVASYMIHKHEKLHIKWMPFPDIKIWFTDSLPFFWSTSASVIKQQSITVIIGTFFKMSDVALYDLGYKIFTVPNILFGSINAALFPKIANDNRKSVIKKVFLFEALAGFIVIISVAIFGKWVVLFMGGQAMLGAYPIAVVMSFGVLTFLLVGGYINFIFVPQHKYYLVTRNQIVAFIVFFTLTTLGLIIWKNILSIAIAWSIAGLFEILYCNILIKKHKLF
jgi:PST family polysaccharide transporter